MKTIRHILFFWLIFSQWTVGQGFEDFVINYSSFQSCVISNFDKINTDRHEFGPVLFGGGIVYVTNIESEEDKKKGPYFDLKFTHFTKDIDIPFSEQIQSEHHLGSVTFSPDQKNVYYTKNETEQKGKDGKYHMKLYQSYYGRKKEWIPRKDFRYNSDDYSVMHPTISADGTLLIFASNMPGGHGGYDLYYCISSGRGWKRPVNLGSNVNTEKNEVFPFLFENNWVIYASDGREGHGKLDLYISDNHNETWSYAENLGNKVNTAEDDFSLILNQNQKVGYFASAKEGGYGKDDIYKIEFSEPILKRKEIVLPAYSDFLFKVYAGKDSIAIEGASLTFIRHDFERKESTSDYSIQVVEEDPVTGIITLQMIPAKENDENRLVLTSNAEGKLKVKLEKFKKYTVEIEKDGYLKEVIEIEQGTAVPEFSILLKKI